MPSIGRVWEGGQTPQLKDGVAVGDLWVDITGATPILKVCTTVSPSSIWQNIATSPVDLSGPLVMGSLPMGSISGMPDSPASPGTVTSVGLSAPAVFSVANSPVVDANTLALTFASGQAANKILATPDGTTGALSLRSMVTGDLPVLPSIFTTTELVNQLAAIGATTILTAAVDSLYLVAYNLEVTSAGGLAGTSSVSFIANDDIQSQTFTSGTVSLLSGGATTQGVFVIRVGNGQVLQYSTTLTTVVGAPAYRLTFSYARMM